MTRAREEGQASVLLLAGMVALLVGGLALGAVQRGLGVRSDAQRAADLAALAAGRVLVAGQPRLFEPPLIDGRPNPQHLERAQLVAWARRTAEVTVGRNGATVAGVSFPDDGGLAPMRVSVTARTSVRGPGVEPVVVTARATAEVLPAEEGTTASAKGGGYSGPLAFRQGKPMRPDVALAFDRMAAAARRDGHHLLVVSGFRSDAEQAVLFARNPDPKWVAPPGRSLHRLGTELDLGPTSAYGWLAQNAPRFHFVKRYAWEPWHFGFVLNAGTRSVGHAGRWAGGGERRSALPSFVPARFAPAIAKAAQRWNVAGSLLAAQIWQESKFNPFARSPAGALGIAQFMPGTARGYGLRNPFDPDAAIDAQAHLMRDLLRRFGSVPLALAAYNAGPAPVERCGCIPPYPETRAYVASILGLLGGAGDGAAAGADTDVRLVS